MSFIKKITICLLFVFSIILIGCKKINNKISGTYFLKTVDNIIQDSYIKVYEDNTADVYNVEFEGEKRKLKIVN